MQHFYEHWQQCAVDCWPNKMDKSRSEAGCQQLSSTIHWQQLLLGCPAFQSKRIADLTDNYPGKNLQIF